MLARKLLDPTTGRLSLDEAVRGLLSFFPRKGVRNYLHRCLRFFSESGNEEAKKIIDGLGSDPPTREHLHKVLLTATLPQILYVEDKEHSALMTECLKDYPETLSYYDPERNWGTGLIPATHAPQPPRPGLSLSKDRREDNRPHSKILCLKDVELYQSYLNRHVALFGAMSGNEALAELVRSFPFPYTLDQLSFLMRRATIPEIKKVTHAEFVEEFLGSQLPVDQIWMAIMASVGMCPEISSLMAGLVSPYTRDDLHVVLQSLTIEEIRLLAALMSSGA